MSIKLGELLVREGHITEEQLQQALAEQKRGGYRLGHAVVKLGLVEDATIAAILSRQYGVSYIDLAKVEIDPQVLRKISSETARRYLVIPVSRSGQNLTVAMADPTNIFAMDDIRYRTGDHIKPVVATETAIHDAIEKYLGAATGLQLKDSEKALMELDDPDVEVLEETEEIDLEELERGSEDAPVVQLVNHILTDAVRRGASDIHIEPFERELRVRCRIEGILYLVMNPPLKLKENITTRIKILAKLDIAERRIPQGGRFKIRTKGNGKMRELEFRVSVLPTLFGEKVVLRLLDKDQLQLDMVKLGFEKASLARFEKAILKPWGMVLVTGPTGSGKTNTLYSAISRLNTMETNIMTAEDPVEFNLLGVNQVQVREQVGLNFASALREFLRQDPNIILVGEVRDFETAEIAVKAALTGHMVLSTLHTNDAPSTINQLLNMGIEPFLVATSLHLVCAQRLVRRICKECRTMVELPAHSLVDIGFTPEEAKDITVFKGRGCTRCNNTGYKGRVGLYEVMECSDSIRQLILEGATAMDLKRQAAEEGMLTLRQSGLAKIQDGVTTVEEVVRETVR